LNKGKNTPAQSFSEMIEAGKEDKKRGKIYREQSADFIDGRLSELVNKTAHELKSAATKEPVSLRDTDEVKARTLLYLRSCEEAACFPSITGLARSMGLSRQAVYDVIWRKSPPATAEWLEICRDSFSDILGESSLKGQCAAIPAIFLQKALYGLRESSEIEIVAKNTNGTLEDIADKGELQRRIEASVVLDEIDE